MQLTELFTNIEIPPPDFERFSRRVETMPPIDTDKLEIAALAGKQRRALRTLYEGTGTLVVKYKGTEGGVTSLEENQEGENWNIVQVQGSSTKKSYRVSTCLDWQRLTGERIDDFAHHPEAEVRHITMPNLFEITNIGDARSQRIEQNYQSVRTALRMRYSKELGLYISDINTFHVRRKFNK